MRKVILIFSFIYFFTVLYSQELKLKYYNIQLKNMLDKKNSMKLKKINKIDINTDIEKKLNFKMLDVIDYYSYFFNKNEFLSQTYKYYSYYYKYYQKSLNIIKEYKNKFEVLRDVEVKIESSKDGKIDYNFTYRFKIYFDLEKIIKGELKW